jgi:phage terminase small subunit
MTAKQQRFCEEYMIDLNATQAAIRAGYSPQNAEQLGYQLLQKTSVSEEIARLKAAQSARTGITADRVLREYGSIAFAALEADGMIRPKDKLHALDAIAKHLGIDAPKESEAGDTGELEKLLGALQSEVRNG